MSSESVSKFLMKSEKFLWSMLPDPPRRSRLSPAAVQRVAVIQIQDPVQLMEEIYPTDGACMHAKFT